MTTLPSSTVNYCPDPTGAPIGVFERIVATVVVEAIQKLGLSDQNGEMLGIDCNPMYTYGVNTLIPTEFDAIDVDYTGDLITSVRYYTGGLTGTLQATLTITYTPGGLIDTVVRT